MKPFRALAGLLLLLLLALAPARAQEPLKLRIAYTGVPTHLLPLLFVRPEILKHYGKSFTIQATQFRGSAPEITALASGDLDISLLGFSSFGLALQNAHIEDLRLIGDGHRDGVPGYFSNQYVVTKSSPIARVEDLKGKVLATNAIGGAADIGMRAMLLDHGLVATRDYQIVEIGFPNMIPTLREGKVDLATLTQPFASIAGQQGETRVLFTLRDAIGENQATVMVARAPFIAAHRAALVDFFEDAQAGMRWFTDPANRAAAIKIIADDTHQPVSAFQGWLFTKRDNYRDTTLRPNLKALQANLDLTHKLGFLKIAIDVNHYADLSMVNEAAARHPATAP